MALSNELITQFVKAVKNDSEKPSETVSYGTIKISGGVTYVQLDGSTIYTPVTSTAVVSDGDRVTVMIKDHSAVVTGNLTSPSATQSSVDSAKKELGDKIDEFDIIIADKVSTEQLNAVEGLIRNLSTSALTADSAVIKDLQAADVTITGKIDAVDLELTGRIDAHDGKFENVDASFIKVNNTLTAVDAKIGTLEATDAEFRTLQSDYGDFKSLATDKFGAIDGSIKNLETDKLSAEQADLKYVNIDFTNIDKAWMEEFYSKSGLIQYVTADDLTVTGHLVGVTITGDLIEGGTVVADKLVILGTDGLYYKLNYNGETIAGEQTDQNSLNGSVITAKSITATQISVEDLVAFDATVGGFHLTPESIYSGVKESVDNTTRGIYLDTDGQVSFGDETNFVKFYRETSTDENGNTVDTYKLAIAVESLELVSRSKSLDDVIDELDGRLEDSREVLSEEIHGQLEDLQATKNAIYQRVSFDENGLTISCGEGAMKLHMTNDTIGFYKGEIDVNDLEKNRFGWWDGVDFHTGNIVIKVEERAQFGNFAFVPRSDGSLSFLKVGG